ncbi:carbohydrate ABC transporter permease [Tengunoibacter tsumagoiensis]|uniref:Glycerol-3-phosphate ABC transporter permease n=1 Tax=Tengunoibacter tsumagoiensis TaxID=2014871 RepID=A0A401ZXM4_9CHLR|nr:sugar ABC transporter permease [Tengunoibacter tsumagoiensis]GCE11587.1 glycerol-3-phosphate ABC transporter permease [Tengunoibacter tsumagoiensis]
MEVEHSTYQEATVKAQSHSPIQRMKRGWFIGQAYLYVLPAILVLGVFSYLPSAFVFYMSLFDWSFLNQGDQPYVGLSNYTYIFQHVAFWQSLQVTLLYVLLSVPIHLILSLLLGLCLMTGIRAKAFWRLAIFSPFILPMVATTTIWYWMFDPYHGLFDGILRLLHLQTIDWLGDPHWILLSIIFYTTWKSVGFSVVIFMAGLANISPSLGEAARVDGANSAQVLRHITWPLLLPITLVVLLLGTIDAFKMFQPVFLFVGASGGQANAARTLGLYLYAQGFSDNPHDGRGAAISVILFLIVFTIAVGQFGLTRRQNHSME